MSKIYNNSLKAIFVKIVQINENIEDKELKKIDEIYFKLTGNNLSKKNIYNQILNINNIEPTSLHPNRTPSRRRHHRYSGCSGCGCL
jgi:hypothetical protein